MMVMDDVVPIANASTDDDLARAVTRFSHDLPCHVILAFKTCIL